MPRHSNVAQTGTDVPSSNAASSPRTKLSTHGSLSAIRIADRVGRSFSPNACLLGFRYFARHGVELDVLTDRRATATVKGQRTHRVELHATGEGDGKLSGSCSCAPESLEPTPCRHVWAAVLEVDRRGGFPCLRNAKSLLRFVPSSRQDPSDPPRAIPSSTAKPKAKAGTSNGKGRPPIAPARAPGKVSQASKPKTSSADAALDEKNKKRGARRK